MGIRIEWTERVAKNPDAQAIQDDARIRRWGWIAEANRYLRFVLLEDGQTAPNAFFDRNYQETQGED